MQFKTLYDFCQIEVESFDFNRFLGCYECYCVTLGVPDEIEPTALLKTVWFGELKDAVCNPDGNVHVTYGSDPENTDPIPFNRWAADMNDFNKAELSDHLSAIINKRESRNKTWHQQVEEIVSLIKAA